MNTLDSNEKKSGGLLLEVNHVKTDSESKLQVSDQKSTSKVITSN